MKTHLLTLSVTLPLILGSSTFTVSAQEAEPDEPRSNESREFIERNVERERVAEAEREIQRRTQREAREPAHAEGEARERVERRDIEVRIERRPRPEAGEHHDPSAHRDEHRESDHGHAAPDRHREGMAPGPEAERARRLHHVRVAIENLHQAGLHDVAERLEQQLRQRLERRERMGMRGRMTERERMETRVEQGRPEMERREIERREMERRPEGPRQPEMPPEIREMRESMLDMRRQIEEMRRAIEGVHRDLGRDLDRH